MRALYFGWILAVLVMALQVTTTAALPPEPSAALSVVALLDAVDGEEEPPLFDPDSHALTVLSGLGLSVSLPPAPCLARPTPYNAQAPPTA